MGNSWELTDEQKKEINEKNREIGQSYDPQTGRKKNQVDSTDGTDDEAIEGMDDRQRKTKDDDDYVR